MSTLASSQMRVCSPELVYGSLYDNAVEVEMFMHLVVCRLFNAGSKFGRRLKEAGASSSFNQAREKTKNIYCIIDTLPETKKERAADVG